MAINLEKCFPKLKDFIFYMETVKGFTAETVYAYYTDLLSFFKYLKYIKSPPKLNQTIDTMYIKDIDTEFLSQITYDDIMQFFHYLKSIKDYSERTRARRASSIKTFFKYLHLIREDISADPTEKLEFPRQKKELPKFMQADECITLLNSINGKNKERDYCIIVIFLNCGIRLSELVGINLRDIQKDGRIVIRGKGRKERMIYFNQACQEAVKDYQNFKTEFFKEKDYDRNALFIGNTGKRLSKRWVEKIVNKRIEDAGFGGRGLSPHKLRHTAATIMYQRGGDIRVLKDILGHVDLGTTQIYTHVSNEQIKNVMCESPITRSIIQNDKNPSE